MTGGRQRKRAESAIRANSAPARPTESITPGEMLAATEPTAGRRPAPRQRQRLGGRGPRGGPAGGAANRPYLARQRRDRTVHGTHDILIVTPYNAQIRAIEAALSASGQTGFRVGTVDKLQGQ